MTALLAWIILAALPASLQLSVSKRSDSIKFNYDANGSDGPQAWPKKFSGCAGKHQSPIDIKTGDLIEESKLTAWEFLEYEKPLRNFELTNNGHSLKVAIPEALIGHYQIRGGNKTYDLLQFHFHWGKDDEDGSEHTVDGKHYPLELHLVHRDSDLTTKEALKTKGGIAVLGIFYHVQSFWSVQTLKEYFWGEHDNPDVQLLLDNLEDLKKPGSSITIHDDLNLLALFPEKTDKFYRYEGSLTTPGCNEVVDWTIYASPNKDISRGQIDDFRKQLTTTEGRELAENHRPIQELNGRKVYKN